MRSVSGKGSIAFSAYDQVRVDRCSLQSESDVMASGDRK